MTYPSSNPPGNPSPYSSGGYGYHAPSSNPSVGATSLALPSQGRGLPLHRYLMTTVVALGLASYLFSYGPMFGVADIGWGVRFAVLAGALAAFGLLPRHTVSSVVVAALAALGFLDALALLINAADTGWAATVIVVLNGIQAGVAVWALLNGDGEATEAGSSEYQAYADYYRQAAQYYQQYAQQGPPDQQTVAGAGQAQHSHHMVGTTQQASGGASYADFISDGGAESRARHGDSTGVAAPTAGPAGPHAGAVEQTPPVHQQQSDVRRAPGPPGALGGGAGQ